MFRTVFAATAIALALAGPLCAQSVDEARELYKAGVHAAAVEVFQRFAAKGDANALNALAIAYWNGNGIAQDLDEALRLLEASAAQDFPRAIYNLGIFWRDGDGHFDQDLEKAARYLKRAVELDYTFAYNAYGRLLSDYMDPPQYEAAVEILRAGLKTSDGLNADSLGWAYAKGQGVPQDFEQAAAYFQIGYEQDIRHSAAGLAYLAARGQGAPADLDKAMGLVREYIRLSQADGYDTDHAYVALDIEDGFALDSDGPFAIGVLEEGIAAGETRAMIQLGLWKQSGTFTPEDLEGARALFRQAGEAGDGNGYVELSLTYDDADPAEAKLAFEASQKAYDLGAPAARSGLSYHYYWGYGVSQDLEKAHEYAMEGASSDDAIFEDYYNVGTDFLNGTGVETDLEKAFDYLTRAYNTYDVGAESYLGDFHRAGEVVAQDLGAALAYYEEGVQWGDTRSIWALGRAYELGEGVPQSYATAYLLYLQAFDAEEFEAARSLAVAAADWPNGSWASAEDAYRYCLTAAAWNKEPFRDFSEADCAGYRAELTESQAGSVEAGVE